MHTKLFLAWCSVESVLICSVLKKLWKWWQICFIWCDLASQPPQEHWLQRTRVTWASLILPSATALDKSASSFVTKKSLCISGRWQYAGMRYVKQLSDSRWHNISHCRHIQDTASALDISMYEISIYCLMNWI